MIGILFSQMGLLTFKRIINGIILSSALLISVSKGYGLDENQHKLHNKGTRIRKNVENEKGNQILNQKNNNSYK